MMCAVIALKRGAVADMGGSAIDIAEALARLAALTIFELRGEWRRLHRAPPPMRLSRDLLMRGITYKLQERPLGGDSKSIMRRLERLNLDSEASDAQKPAPPISLKAGTRLVREWRGVTHTVLVHADAVLFSIIFYALREAARAEAAAERERERSDILLANILSASALHQ